MRPSRRSTDWARPRSALCERLRAWLASDDRGSASLEFLTVGVLLLVPVVYLVLALASVQSAALGVEGAARHAARVASLAGDERSAEIVVERSVRVALADYGIDADAASVRLDCGRANDCSAPGARVRVDVDARVVLPLVPSFLGLDRFANVAVAGHATQTVSRFAAVGG
ncbi:TadE family protein [Agromyces protaetiae]|uniref:TadE family protein n=1 Tax=Agromyces protaetiae TaxID=2509455 RepID=A0A4P6FSW7_9MICO|nr:TadE family protein [Agromyces protaetiae]QAY73658.1 TadE family protein [Agromyces protaetiae]